MAKKNNGGVGDGVGATGGTHSNITQLPRGERRQLPLKDLSHAGDSAVEDRLDRPGDKERIEEIAASMRVVGQLQPIMVENRDGKYTVLFGRRRIAAARVAGLTEIDAVVVPPLLEETRRFVVAIENMQRQDLTPVEESIAVAELLRMAALKAGEAVGAVVAGVTITRAVIDEIWKEPDTFKETAYVNDILEQPKARAKACELVAAALGKTPSWVRDRMYVARLNFKGRKLVQAGKLPLTHAREIAKVADVAVREDLAERFAAGGDDSRSDTEAGDLAQLRVEVSKRVFSLHQVPWRLEVAFASQRACDGCPHNSATNPGLFEHGGMASTKMVGGFGQAQVDIVDGKDGPVCTLHTCYGEKLAAAKRAVASAAGKIADQADRKDKAPVHVPAFLDTKAVEAKVKERKARAKETAARTGSSAEPSKEQQKRDAAQAKRDAEYKRQDLARDAMRPVLEGVEKIARKSPLVRAAMLLWEDSFVEGDEPRGSAALLKRIAAVSNETAPQLFADLAALTDKDAFALSQWNTTEKMARDLAAAFGFTMAEVPALETLLPKSEPKVAAPTKQPKSAKGRKAVPA